MKRACALIAAAALLFAGCAKESVKGKGPTAPIRLACVMNPDFSIVQVALAMGYFEAEGLAVTVTPFVVGKEALASVIRGEADLATVLETPVVFAILGGEKLGVLASIATSDKNQALVANGDSGVASPGDLVGKTIAVTKGTAAEYFLHSFLVAHKIADSRIVIVNTPPGELFPALTSGKAAAVVLWNPLLLDVDRVLGGKGLVFPGESIYTANSLIVGGQAFLARNPDAMKGWIRALIKGEDFMKRSPDKAQAIIASNAKTDVGGIRGVLNLFRFRVSLEQVLLLVLEDESRWAMSLRPADFKSMPNYLEYLYADALQAVAPDRLRLVR
jgi:ABC-type nitrate/sulfonate/bicarbonate transport system substrate-binding protein